MAATVQWYVLIQDNDGHWYVCQADRQAEAEAYFAECANYWKKPMKKSYIEEPAWLVRVGGAPSLVRFKDYEVN